MLRWAWWLGFFNFWVDLCVGFMEFCLDYVVLVAFEAGLGLVCRLLILLKLWVLGACWFFSEVMWSGILTLWLFSACVGLRRGRPVVFLWGGIIY